MTITMTTNNLLFYCTTHWYPVNEYISYTTDYMILLTKEKFIYKYSIPLLKVTFIPQTITDWTT